MAVQPSLLQSTQAAYAGPLYAQLKARLRDRIRHEDWSAGTLIPSESDLAREYGVSVGTARRALEGLETDGWIVRKQGRGTFVTDLARMQLERLCRFRGAGDGPGFDGYIVRLLRVEKGAATAQEALELKLSRKKDAPGEVVRMQRHYFKDEDSTVLEDSVFPADLFPGLEAIKRVPTNVFSIMVDDYSIVPHRSSEVISANVARGGVAEQLRVSDGAPILTARAVVWDIDGRRVMLMSRHAHARGIRYEVDLC